MLLKAPSMTVRVSSLTKKASSQSGATVGEGTSGGIDDCACAIDGAGSDGGEGCSDNAGASRGSDAPGGGMHGGGSGHCDGRDAGGRCAGRCGWLRWLTFGAGWAFGGVTATRAKRMALSTSTLCVAYPPPSIGTR
jgi:hypothetical protein